MATPTISEYTAHLRQDKATMRDHLLNANITTKESDTFTDLTRIALEKGNAIRRIYVQPDEPTAKHGLWFKRDAVENFDVVSDPVPFVGDTLSAFNVSYNPDSAYDKVKETRTVRANNTIYYLAIDNHKASYPDEAFRIYQYDPYTNAYTKIQTYTANEVYNVRGDGGYYAISVFRKNGVVCIDSEGEYLYLICGGYDALSESQNYITRFGLKSHSAERVHTRQSKWFPIPAGDLSNAQIVDNKIYIFGQSTNAAAYGNSWNTRIIDLTTGSEATLNNGPVAYQGRTVKVNSHLIAGFGGGNVSMNGGQGMNEVRLFDTLTNTTTKIATLTNRNNSRVLTVVGNLIYFVEYRNSGSSSKSVGYVNLVDNSVTYIDDVFTPKLQNIASNPAIYLPSARAIVLGNYVGQTYSYNLDTKPYDKDTVVLFQSTGVAAQYVVDLFTTNNFKTDVPFNISDAWFYKAGEGLETTGEVYYGNGIEWLPLAHGNTNGGVNALQLQHKTVEITEAGVTHVTPDAGFEGLRYIDVDCKVEAKEDLTEELANYDSSLTTQETSIQEIIEALEGKATGGGGGANTADKPNISVYVQATEPEDKNGIWVKTTGTCDYLRYINPKITEFKTEVDAQQEVGYKFSNGITVGNEIYSFGGRPNNTSDTTVAFKYNIDTKEITKLRDLPTTTSFPGVTSHGKYIYIVGGRKGTNTKISKVYRYNIETDEYDTLPDLYIGVEQPSVSIKDDYMYITSSDLGATVLKYSLIDGSYRTITTEYGSAYSCIYNNSLYIFYSSGSIPNVIVSVYEFNLQTEKTTKVATFKTGVWIYGRCLQDGCVVYLINAYNPYSVTAINLLTKQFVKYLLPDIDELHYATYAFTRGCLYSIGGSGAGTNVKEILKTPIRTPLNFSSNVVTLFRDGDFSNNYSTTIEYDGVPTNVSFWDIKYYRAAFGLDNTSPLYYGDGTQWIKFKN